MAKKPFSLRTGALNLLLTPMAVLASTSVDSKELSTPTETHNTAIVPNTPRWNPYVGRAFVSGTATREAIFDTDELLPVYGTQDGFVFGDVMGSYASDNTFYTSPGAGVRRVWNNQIVGAYFFGDYLGTDLGKDFWSVSPGIEWMSPRWDAHLNFYFPTTNQQQMGPPVFLDTLGVYDQVSFQPGTYNQYDGYMAPVAVVGDGGDLAVGYSLPSIKGLRARIYVGGYYYWPEQIQDVNTITGITGGVEVPFTRYFQIAVRNSYDNVTKETVALSLSLTFGGKSTLLSDDVHDRLLDRVQRHVGIIGTGAGTYAQQGSTYRGTGLEYDNVHFISPTASGTGDGTYGNSAELTQTTLDDITGNARIYIQGDNSYSESKLNVSSGQDFYGRTSDYTAPATGGNRPLIQMTDVGFAVTNSTGISENTFSDLLIDGGGVGTNGLNITQASNGIGSITLNDVGVSDFKGSGVFNSENDGKLIITATDSQFIYNTEAGVDIAQSYGQLIFRATGSVFDHNGDSGVHVDEYENSGSDVKNTVTVSNTTFSNNGNKGLAVYNHAVGYLTVTATNSHFDNNVANGLEVYNKSIANLIVQVTESSFNNNATGTNGGYGIFGGNYDTGQLSITATDSQFYENGIPNVGAGGIGVINGTGSGGSLNVITNSDFEFNVDYGIQATGNGTLGDTQINYTGATFAGNGSAATNQASAGADVSWTP